MMDWKRPRERKIKTSKGMATVLEWRWPENAIVAFNRPKGSTLGAMERSGLLSLICAGEAILPGHLDAGAKNHATDMAKLAAKQWDGKSPVINIAIMNGTKKMAIVVSDERLTPYVRR